MQEIQHGLTTEVESFLQANAVPELITLFSWSVMDHQTELTIGLSRILGELDGEKVDTSDFKDIVPPDMVLVPYSTCQSIPTLLELINHN